MDVYINVSACRDVDLSRLGKQTKPITVDLSRLRETSICLLPLNKIFNICLVIINKYNKAVEVDFYIPEESYAIQASYSIMAEDAQDTYTREVEALKKLNAYQHLDRMVIVTYDEEALIEIGNGQSIEVIPAWKWLLA